MKIERKRKERKKEKSNKISNQERMGGRKKQDRFTTRSMTCGTGSLFWRVGRGLQIPLVPRRCRQTNIQDWWCTKLCKIQQTTDKTGGALRH